MRRRCPRLVRLCAVAIASALMLSSCAGWPFGTPPRPPPATTATTHPTGGPGTTTSPSELIPPTEEPYGFTFTNETSAVNEPYPIGIAIETPHLTGATLEAAAALDRAFAEQVADVREDLDEQLALAPPRAENNDCDAAVQGQWFVSTLAGVRKIDAIHRGMASVTTLFARTTGCRGAVTTASSVTLDLATARVLDLEDVADPDSATYRAATTRLATDQCPGLDVARSDLTDDDVAFTPTDAGLVLTWGADEVVPASCGTVSVSVPWSETGTPTGSLASPLPTTPATTAAPTKPKPTATTKPSAAPSPSKKAARPANCPPGAALPDGIDPRVCGPAPAGARSPVEVDGGASGGVGYAAYSPSGNIACDVYDDGAWCFAKRYTFAPPPDRRPAEEQNVVEWVPNAMVLMNGTAQAGAGMGGVSTAMSISDEATIQRASLGYDEALVLGSVACVSQEIGMSCWDTGTTHGFFVSASQYAVW